MSIAILAQGIAALLLLVEFRRVRMNKAFSPKRLLYLLILVAIVLAGINLQVYQCQP